MATIENIKEYTEQIDLGVIPEVYKALLKYMMGLRTHFINQYSQEYKVGNFYQGYMDMSYFPITPMSFQKQKLKIGVVFNHEKIRFELWLVGQNKKIQKEFWEQFRESSWNKKELSKSGQESILQRVIDENPNFSDLDKLTERIENKTLELIDELQIIIQ